MRVYIGTELDWWSETGERQPGVYAFTDRDEVLFLEEHLEEQGPRSFLVKRTNGVTLILEEQDG